MKKIFGVVILVLLLITGCGKFSNKHNVELKQEVLEEKPVVNIQFASWGSKTETDVMSSLIADFEEKNPDIKIEFLHFPQNYFQKLHLLFASNNAPDVVFLNNQYLPIYANAGRLEPAKFNMSIYNDKVVQALSWKDKCYAVPRDISLLVVYYNKNLFDQAGVDYPSEKWTIKQMVKKAVKIKKKTGAFGISFEEEPLFYLPYVMSEGGTFFDLENKKTQKGLKIYANLRKKHEVAPTRAEIGSATMAQMFLQEKVAMHLSGRWVTPTYVQKAKFDWGVVDFPAGEEGVVVPLDASGWAIAKSSVHKEEAQRFISYLASKESIKKFVKTGLIVPARMDVEFSDSEVYQRSLENSQPTPVSVDYNKVLDSLKIKLETMFN